MTESNGVRAFFERLAEDDEFRAAVVADPATVMDDYGIEYDPSQIPDTVRLPSKEALRENLGEYVDKLGNEPVGFGVWMFVIDPDSAT